MTTVTTTGGQLTGAAMDGLTVYRGIPYAEAPTGARRWRPPVPARPWAGVFDAVRFGPAPPQAIDGPPSPLPTLDPGPMDEDCLSLNVWAPVGVRDRPVLVWIYGGAFISGSSAISTYDGARLAREHDVVVVSLNYRLGALGFAPMDGVANLGLLDQLLALEWIQDNIDAFGGDPALVTVFGESAGGGSVLHLLAAPASEGLARRAIVQSGATTLTLTGGQAAEVADRVRQVIEGDPHDAPVGAILDAQAKVAWDLVATLGTMSFHPTVDDELVLSRPAVALAGRPELDLLIGTTRDELNLYLDPAAPTLERERLVKRAARYLASQGVGDADRVLAAYDDLASPTDAWAAMRTDAEMWLPAVDIATVHAQAGGRTYAYRFDRPAAAPNTHLGACHAIDLPFTFGTFDQAGWDRFVGSDDAAEALGIAMRESWAVFAATGDPSSPRLAGWRPYTPTDRATMLLDDACALAVDPRAAVREAWTAARQ